MQGRAVRSRTGVAAWGLVVAFALGAVAVGWAGVDPSPFVPATNQLNAVTNVLTEVDRHLEGLTIPPDPFKPPNPNLVNELNALAQTLEVQGDRVEAAIEAVLGTPPDPFTPAYEEALGAVHSAASIIAERAGIPPDPWTPEEREALAAVEEAAQAIARMTGPYS